MDKTSRKIMKYLSKQKQGTSFIRDYEEGIETLAKEISASEEDISEAIKYLDKREIVEIIHYSSGPAYGFHLSHIGANWKYFRWIAFVNYLKEKWIDFFALLASVAAIIISVISLLG